MIDKRLILADNYNRQGIGYANKGNFNEAVKCFKKALSLIPNANSCYFLGLTFHKKGKLDEAEINYREATKLSPNFSMAHNNLGTIYLEKKDYLKAILQFNSAISSDPKNSSAYNNLGNAYKFTGKPDEVIKNYKKALELEPNTPETLNNLGLIYFEQKDYENSLEYLRKAIVAGPGYAQAYFHLAIILSKQNKFEEAATALENYIKLIPDNAEAFALLANFYLNIGNLDNSLENFKKALIINPNSPYIINDLGNLYKQKGGLKKALEYYQKALKLDPNLAGTYNNIGVVFLNQERLDDAAKALEKALKIDPKMASANYHLGLIYERKKELDKAVNCFKAALEADPDLKPALSILVYVLMQECDWDNYLKEAAVLDKVLLDETPFLSVIRNQDSKTNYLIAKEKSSQIKKSVAAFATPYSFANRPKNKRIRIGYLSNDFHTHATAHLVLTLFETHDRSKFEIYAYSYDIDDGSSYRKRIKEGCDKFRDVFNLGFYETADRIYNDKIDILVDLKGHTKDSRLEICSLRPAPIQVTYLGFPGTTGADFIDYLICDKIVAPPEVAPCYSEKLVYLPDSYQINNDQRPIWEGKFKRSELGLPDKGIVFSSFNRSYKIDIETFKTWMKILADIPGSVLWLYQDNPIAEKNLKKAAAFAKIDPQRIIFAGEMPHSMHLKRISLSDICLDTFTCNGHTTTSDALWAGVPVITLQGKHFASRVASSILTAIGLPELITHSAQEYYRLAVKLAQNPKALKALKEKLAKNRLTMPLFNTQKFVANLEKAYLKMKPKEIFL